jgi:hypothetical protein
VKERFRFVTSTLLLALLGAASMLVRSAPASAYTIGSMFSGEHFSIPGGIVLMQDGDHPELYYLMPRQFSLVTSTEIETDPASGETALKTHYGFSHGVIRIEGKEYSLYSFRVKLDSFGPIAIGQIRNRVYQEVNKGKKIGEPKTHVVVKPRAPMCGATLGLPVSAGGAPGSGGIEVTYGFSDAGQGSCTQTGAMEEFTVEIRVPMSMEPAVADSFIRGVGISLPTVKIRHPYQLRNTLKIHVDTHRLIERLRDFKSISGGVAFVQAAASQELSDALISMEAVGDFSMKLEDPDPKIREHMYEIVIEMLKSTFFKFAAFDPKAGGGEETKETPETCKLSAADALVKTAKGTPIPMCMTVGLNESEFKGVERGNFDLDLMETTYGTIQSEVGIALPAIPKELFDPRIFGTSGTGGML